MTKRVILCDLDGTLIDERYKLTAPLPALVDLLKRKQAEDVLVGLNSDTPILSLRGWARKLGMQGPLLGEKGQLLWLSPESSPQIYGKRPDLFRSLKERVLVRAHEEFADAFVAVGDVTQFIIHHGGVYGNDRYAVLINGYRQCSFSAYALKSNEGGLSTDAAFFKRFCDLVFSTIGDDLELLDEPDRNSANGILILHEKGASKNLAVERLMDQVSQDTEITMIGDSDNDIISVARKVKLCAVSNASPLLKQKALETGGMVSSKPLTEGVLDIISRL